MGLSSEWRCDTCFATAEPALIDRGLDLEKPPGDWARLIVTHGSEWILCPECVKAALPGGPAPKQKDAA